MDLRRLLIGAFSLTSVILLQINSGHSGSHDQNIGIIPSTILLSVPLHLELFMGGTHLPLFAIRITIHQFVKLIYFLLQEMQSLMN